MRHLVAHRKLGRTSSHRKALLRNLCTSFVLHERIITTLPKAKELRPFAEKAVTLGRRARAAGDAGRERPAGPPRTKPRCTPLARRRRFSSRATPGRKAKNINRTPKLPP